MPHIQVFYTAHALLGFGRCAHEACRHAWACRVLGSTCAPASQCAALAEKLCVLGHMRAMACKPSSARRALAPKANVCMAATRHQHGHGYNSGMADPKMLLLRSCISSACECDAGLVIGSSCSVPKRLVQMILSVPRMMAPVAGLVVPHLSRGWRRIAGCPCSEKNRTIGPLDVRAAVDLPFRQHSLRPDHRLNSLTCSAVFAEARICGTGWAPGRRHALQSPDLAHPLLDLTPVPPSRGRSPATKIRPQGPR